MTAVPVSGLASPATRATILSGGVAHDFPALSARLAELLGGIGLTTTIRTDIEQAAQAVASTDLLVVNMLRWRMLDGRYAAARDEWGLALSEPARTVVSDWVDGGGAVLALHAACICFDDWPGWKTLVGARWIWDTSAHPPVGPVQVSVRTGPGGRHPIVDGLPDRFWTDDEIYGFLDLADDVEPLLTAEHGGTAHPLLWAREVGAGRVVHTTLGHHLPSYQPPEIQRMVRRGALWALGAPRDVVRAA
ncbi:MAG TPA: ThuA domain-containing protein [Streptosporangiaceae bacterium]|nr:ThuA domain-containing protein [Streptosporangiaceae bacterium]